MQLHSVEPHLVPCMVVGILELDFYELNQFDNLPSIIGRIRTSYLDPLSEWLVRRAIDPHETPDPLDDFDEDDK